MLMLMLKVGGSSHPLLHTLDDEAQVFTHLLFVQVLLFTALQGGGKEDKEGTFRTGAGSDLTHTVRHADTPKTYKGPGIRRDRKTQQNLKVCSSSAERTHTSSQHLSIQLRAGWETKPLIRGRLSTGRLLEQPGSLHPATKTEAFIHPPTRR